MISISGWRFCSFVPAYLFVIVKKIGLLCRKKPSIGHPHAVDFFACLHFAMSLAMVSLANKPSGPSWAQQHVEDLAIQNGGKMQRKSTSFPPNFTLIGHLFPFYAEVSRFASGFMRF